MSQHSRPFCHGRVYLKTLPAVGASFGPSVPQRRVFSKANPAPDRARASILWARARQPAAPPPAASRGLDSPAEPPVVSTGVGRHKERRLRLAEEERL